jgi:hypothetical protein
MDEAITKEYSDIARSLHMTNEQANQVAALGIKYGQQVAEAARNQYNAEVKAWGEQAKAEMGADFEKTMTTAGAGIEAVEKVVPGIKQEVVTLMSKKQEELLKGAALKFYTAGLDIDEAAKDNKSLVALVSELSGFAEAIEAADADIAPHKLCAFIYELSDAFNSFYHENRISGEQDKNKQALWVSLLELCYSELSICIELLGFNAPDRM